MVVINVIAHRDYYITYLRISLVTGVAALVISKDLRDSERYIITLHQKRTGH